MLLTLTPKLAGVGFSTLIVNLNAAADGTVGIQLHPLGGGVSLLGNFGLSGAGQNFFRMQATSGDLIRMVTFTSTVDLDDIRQVRVGGFGGEIPPAQPAPEPGTLALLGLGLAGLAASRRRRR